METFAGMVEQMDENIDKVFDYLEQRGHYMELNRRYWEIASSISSRDTMTKIWRVLENVIPSCGTVQDGRK
ncbi:hypothetical protein C8R42DRAFT_731373 [Lentinula raphanica]|nr:hypothetical protein C8R42DRAFT_731373 [Lentinula raphanica]